LLLAVLDSSALFLANARSDEVSVMFGFRDGASDGWACVTTGFVVEVAWADGDADAEALGWTDALAEGDG
jgi:hypothetical protein